MKITIRKVTILCLCILWSFSLCSITYAEEGTNSEKYGRFFYSINEDGTAQITWYNLYEEDEEQVIIPEEINGHQVTGIGEHAFLGCKASRIVLPEGLTRIDDNAFQSCINLTEISLPETLEKIGDCVFSQCMNLSGIYLPDSLVEIGANPFVEIPSVAFEISSEHPAFSVKDGCLFNKSGTELIYCPHTFDVIELDSVEIIGDYAFKGCEELKKIYMSEELEHIGNCAFCNCSGLVEIYYSSENLRSIGEYAFSGCKGLVFELALPEGLETIGDFAFSGCDMITRISLPDSINEMGANPFKGCHATFKVSHDHPYLTEEKEVLLSKPDNRLICGKDCRTFFVPSDVKIIGKAAFSDCRNLEHIKIPESVKRIEESAFANCESLKSVWLPDGMSSIADTCFLRCSGLEKIKIPDEIKSIGDFAFRGCTSLKQIELPDSLEYVGVAPFMETALTEIIFPEGLKTIADMSVYECENLTSVVLPGSLEEIGQFFSDGKPDPYDQIVYTVPKGSYAADWCRENELTYVYSD